MTKQEYHERMKELETEFDNKKKALYVEYATKNNTINIGDIITDHCNSGIVQRMQPSSFFCKYPEMRYLCKILKKDGTPRKDGMERWMYQSDIKKVNGKYIVAAIE